MKSLEKELDAIEFVTMLQSTGRAPADSALIMFSQTGKTWRARFKGDSIIVSMSGDIPTSIQWMQEQKHGC